MGYSHPASIEYLEPPTVGDSHLFPIKLPRALPLFSAGIYARAVGPKLAESLTGGG
jgi:hypothetical protein